MTEDQVNELRGMQMHQVRKIAQEHYGIKCHSSMTKDQIIAAIKDAGLNADYSGPVKDLVGGPGPGMCRIVLHKKPGEKNRPKIKQVNGYKCGIPRGVEVEIPYDVYLSILDEQETALEEDLSEPINSPDRWRWTKAPRESVTLVAKGPDGPNPKDQHQRMKERKLVPYRAFVEKFGYFPTDVELRAAQINGLIDVVDPKFLAAIQNTGR